MIGYIPHVLIELLRAITFESITKLIGSIYDTICLTELNNNNYTARLAKDRFKSYGPPKFYKDMGYLIDHYVTLIFYLSYFIHI